MLRPMIACLMLTTPVLADETKPELTLELNAAETVAGNCRLTFLVINALGSDLGALAYETVILTADGAVERLTIFDFGEVPDGKPRVRQFDLAGLDCAAIGRLLMNGASACTGVTEGTCIDRLVLKSRTEQELIG